MSIELYLLLAAALALLLVLLLLSRRASPSGLGRRDSHGFVALDIVWLAEKALTKRLAPKALDFCPFDCYTVRQEGTRWTVEGTYTLRTNLGPSEPYSYRVVLTTKKLGKYILESCESLSAEESRTL